MPATETRPVFDTANFQASRVRASVIPTSLVRCCYYAFVFSLPVEKADLELAGIPLSRILGFILVAVTVTVVVLHRPRLRFDPPPKAFWCFAAYLVLYSALGYRMIVSGAEAGLLPEDVAQGIKTLVQLLVFFWISYNLLQYERIVKGTLLTLAASCIFIAVLQSFGLTDDLRSQDRIAAFDANENQIAEILSLGLLVVIGLGYGRAKTELKIRLLCWLCSAGLAVMIVVTGSRGAMIALFLALLVFFLQGRSLKVKLKVGVVIVLALGFLGWLSYEIEPVRERWEKTYYEGDTAGRDVIFAAAWEMFLEKPLLGWGPVNNVSELGSRLGLSNVRDTHNIYLFLLTETGALGAAFFLAGLWFCSHAAWKARNGIQGALPMSLLLFLLVNGMKGTNHTEKIFWVVLAYAFASANALSIARGARPVVASPREQSTKVDRSPQVAQALLRSN